MEHIKLSDVGTDFNSVLEVVAETMATEKTELLSEMETIPSIDDYSACGLRQAGTRFGFPAKFVHDNAFHHHDLMKSIVDTKTADFINEKQANPMFRSFFGKIYGVLSDKYSIFDDNEICDLISQNNYLMNAGDIWFTETPEHFHARFISSEQFCIKNDNSPLYFAIFIDNSMVGESALRVRCGIYRDACTNGCIWDLKEFTIFREQHKGKKDFADLFNKAISDIGKYEMLLKNKVEQMSNTDSHIKSLTEEDAITYLKSKLVVGKKTAEKVYGSYLEYGGQTQWDLCNAITDVAHDVNLDDRLRLEALAMKVA